MTEKATMTQYRFDHVGFITSDMDVALATYRALGVDVMERNYRRGVHDLAYANAGTDVLLEFQAPPLLAESEEYVAKQGYSIERIAFVCDDAYRAYDELIAAGLESAWKPEPFVVNGEPMAVAAGLWSPEGLMIDVVQHLNVHVPACSPRRTWRPCAPPCVLPLSRLGRCRALLDHQLRTQEAVRLHRPARRQRRRPHERVHHVG